MDLRIRAPQAALPPSLAALGGAGDGLTPWLAAAGLEAGGAAGGLTPAIVTGALGGGGGGAGGGRPSLPPLRTSHHAAGLGGAGDMGLTPFVVQQQQRQQQQVGAGEGLGLDTPAAMGLAMVPSSGDSGGAPLLRGRRGAALGGGGLAGGSLLSAVGGVLRSGMDSAEASPIAGVDVAGLGLPGARPAPLDTLQLRRTSLAPLAAEGEGLLPAPLSATSAAAAAVARLRMVGSGGGEGAGRPAGREAAAAAAAAAPPADRKRRRDDGGGIAADGAALLALAGGAPAPAGRSRASAASGSAGVGSRVRRVLPGVDDEGDDDHDDDGNDSGGGDGTGGWDDDDHHDGLGGGGARGYDDDDDDNEDEEGGGGEGDDDDDDNNDGYGGGGRARGRGAHAPSARPSRASRSSAASSDAGALPVSRGAAAPRRRPPPDDGAGRAGGHYTANHLSLSASLGLSPAALEAHLSALAAAANITGGGTGARPRKSCAAGRALPPDAIAVLKEWMLSAEHFANPYPTDEEKEALATDTGLSVKQVSVWFVNGRKRIWVPLRKRLEREGVVLTPGGALVLAGGGGGGGGGAGAAPVRHAAAAPPIAASAATSASAFSTAVAAISSLRAASASGGSGVQSAGETPNSATSGSSGGGGRAAPLVASGGAPRGGPPTPQLPFPVDDVHPGYIMGLVEGVTPALAVARLDTIGAALAAHRAELERLQAELNGRLARLGDNEAALARARKEGAAAAVMAHGLGAVAGR